MRPAVHVFQIYRTAGEEQVWWRYISANGRGVARCPVSLGSMIEAHASIARVIDEAALAEVVVRPSTNSRWRWLLVAKDEVLARGSGDHDRRVRCEDAAQRFVATVQGAVIDDNVHIFRRRDLAGRTPEAYA